jgi:hypothetical protein
VVLFVGKIYFAFSVPPSFPSSLLKIGTPKLQCVGPACNWVGGDNVEALRALYHRPLLVSLPLSFFWVNL